MSLYFSGSRAIRFVVYGDTIRIDCFLGERNIIKQNVFLKEMKLRTVLIKTYSVLFSLSALPQFSGNANDIRNGIAVNPTAN